MEVFRLYENRLELKFDEDRHLYTVEGEPVESITGVLKVINKPALIPWAVSEAGKYLQKNMVPGQSLDEVQIKNLIDGAKKAHTMRSGSAADIGTMGHKWIEDFIKGENPPLPINEQLRGIATSFMNFAKGHKIEFLDSERKVYSIENRVAGTVDALLRLDGKLTLADWKTGSGIYPEYFLQMGGYDICITEEESFVASGKGEKFEEIQQHMIVNCAKDGSLKIALSDKVMEHKLGFLNALGLMRVLDVIKGEMSGKKRT